MSKILDIKKNLKYGDQRTIAKSVNCSPELVKKVLNGERNCSKGKGKKVIEIALKIIESRARLLMEEND